MAEPARAVLPHVGVVIPSFDGAHVLRPCLDALLAEQPRRCTRTIVVVDDCSRDRTPQLLAGYGDAVATVTHAQNSGFATACNAGAAAAGDVDYLVFLNNDTLPIEGWLDELVTAALDHPDAGAIGARLLYPNGAVQHAGVAFGQDRLPRHLYTGFPGEHPAVLRDKAVAAVTAACMLVPRAEFEALGGFDTAFVNGYEDVDYCLRLGRQGRSVRYCARSVVYHLESVTRWPTGRPEATEHNERLYRERWLEHVEPDDLQHFVADGLLQVEYGASLPRIVASPLVASVAFDGQPESSLEAILRRRTEQVTELQALETRRGLDVLRIDEELRLAAAEPARQASARLLRSGGRHLLPTAGPNPRLVSVLLPVKNGAPDLREQLPALLAQEADAELEFVAVDSGSTDDSVEVLEQYDATIVAIDPRDFDHGLTRNLAADHAKGDVLVLLTHRTRLIGNRWLAPLLAALDGDPTVAGACSRVGPSDDADLLTVRDAERDPSGSPERMVKRIEDWAAYQRATAEKRRLLANFHTVAAALRADIVGRIPFRTVRAIGEDLYWARDVLEAGLALVHEPASQVRHSHAYTLYERFTRNVDDGVANHDIVGRELSLDGLEDLVRAMVADDWRFLREEAGLTGDELERWKLEAALRRVAQGCGQWLGVNHERFSAEVINAFSRVVAMRMGAAAVGERV